MDSVESSRAAERGGAGRLELCDALFDGGTTPSAGMIAACREAVAIPIFVIIRPRGGGFVYSDAELDVMERDIVASRGLGADGVVIGPLTADGTVHEEHTRALVDVGGRSRGDVSPCVRLRAGSECGAGDVGGGRASGAC